MSVFEADSRLAFTGAVAAAGVCIFAAIALIAAAVLVPLSFSTFLFVVLAVGLLLLALWLGLQGSQLREVTYALDRNAFVIRWGDTREIVPMGDVQRVIAATDIEKGLRFLHFPLPGWWFGTAQHAALGEVRMYSTAPLDQQVIIVTPERSYAVSPYDDEAFLDAFRTRLEMRPTQNVQHARLLPAYMQWAIWHDWPALLLLILAIALNLVTFGLSAGRYPSAPAQIALHFDAVGVADRLGDKGQLFGPAAIALITLLVNISIGLALYRKGERLAAQLLWGGSIAVQLLFFVATATIGFSLPS